MIGARLLELSGETRAATVAGGLVWRVFDGGLAGHHLEAGTITVETRLELVTDIGGSNDLVIAQVDSGDLVCMDASSGEELYRGWSEPGSLLVGGAGHIWAYEPESGLAREYDRHAMAGAPVEIGPASRLTVIDDELWWMTKDTRLATSSGRTIEVVPPTKGSGVVACAGSLWLGGDGEIARVSLWSGEQGNSLPAPVGEIQVLTCAGNRVIGADDEWAFVLDPAVDAGATRVDPPLPSPPVAAVGLQNTAWVLTVGNALVLSF